MKIQDALEELNLYFYLTKGCGVDDEMLKRQAKAMRPNVCSIIRQFNSATKGCRKDKRRLLRELRKIGDRHGIDLNFSSVSEAEREMMRLI